ncbi:unnamed protein product [Trifolium pratense]|uniref:Uncharacterized protein n=1 Tax=Trifolium pratense TaxID=57577 RepID=A0ACB0ING6_TRIPR|nr:unnamed protein product [Trifolium pratense]
MKEIHAAGQNGEISGEFCRFNVGIQDWYIDAMSNTMFAGCPLKKRLGPDSSNKMAAQMTSIQEQAKTSKDEAQGDVPTVKSSIIQWERPSVLHG